MVEIAPQIDWGWSAGQEVNKLKARIAELERRMEELERKVSANRAAEARAKFRKGE